MKKKSDLTKQQMVALVLNAYHELKAVFQELPKNKKLTDEDARRQRILADLEYLITKGFKLDPNEAQNFDIFASDFNI